MSSVRTQGPYCPLHRRGTVFITAVSRKHTNENAAAITAAFGQKRGGYVRVFPIPPCSYGASTPAFHEPAVAR